MVKKKKKKSHEISEKKIIQRIFFLRGEKVMLDFDLAILYKVETRALKQAVRRNKKRFPKDFLFELTPHEIRFMVSQNVIPSKSYLGGARPFAFTEQGVAMLSGVLKSETAIEVNIAIMRAFVQMRHLIEGHRDLVKKLEALEKSYDRKFIMVFQAIRELLEQKSKPRIEIGFHAKR